MIEIAEARKPYTVSKSPGFSSPVDDFWFDIPSSNSGLGTLFMRHFDEAGNRLIVGSIN